MCARLLLNGRTYNNLRHSRGVLNIFCKKGDGVPLLKHTLSQWQIRLGLQRLLTCLMTFPNVGVLVIHVTPMTSIQFN